MLAIACAEVVLGNSESLDPTGQIPLWREFVTNIKKGAAGVKASVHWMLPATNEGLAVGLQNSRVMIYAGV